MQSVDKILHNVENLPAIDIVTPKICKKLAYFVRTAGDVGKVLENARAVGKLQSVYANRLIVRDNGFGSNGDDIMITYRDRLSRFILG